MDTEKSGAALLGRAPDPFGPEDPLAAGILVLDTSVVMTASGPVAAARRPPHTLDERGAEAGCSSYVRDTRELVVGRAEGVFSYSVEDRLAAAGFDGGKQCISAIGRWQRSMKYYYRYRRCRSSTSLPVRMYLTVFAALTDMCWWLVSTKRPKEQT